MDYENTTLQLIDQASRKINNGNSDFTVLQKYVENIQQYVQFYNKKNHLDERFSQQQTTYAFSCTIFQIISKETN